MAKWLDKKIHASGLELIGYLDNVQPDLQTRFYLGLADNVPVLGEALLCVGQSVSVLEQREGKSSHR